ncbi:hypothetical protein SAMN05444392_1209 [Seinonella peptonophila]|uniref:Uncharacterized protein n=1 Tax=Seinonella peptonophila TaxID=112248 RepID=A0A1M5B9W5_9BACL|nr:hypothetical protein [Seinonella peptonophila]SHF39279.1 hypothetical protein SAMN05444392_1209 [Seinonella peptonophila]
MKKKVVSLLCFAFAFLMFGSFAAYAATASVNLPANVHHRESKLISVKEGKLHITVNSTNLKKVEYNVYRYVPNGTDQFITGGTTTKKAICKKCDYWTLLYHLNLQSRERLRL